MCQSSPEPPEPPEPSAKPAPPPAKEAPRAPVTGSTRGDAAEEGSQEARNRRRQSEGTNRLRIRFSAPSSMGSGLLIPSR